jgi:hypothetical protein
MAHQLRRGRRWRRRPREETAETELRGRRAPELPPSSSGRGWGGFEWRLQAATVASSGRGWAVFERARMGRLRPAASSGGGVFDWWRLGLAREERRGVGGNGGEDFVAAGRLNRYLAKRHLCVVHYARYAPRIFDT